MARRIRPEDDTLCIHAGEDRHGRNASITTDVVNSAVFVLDGVEELRKIKDKKSSAYMYTRFGNPTTRAAEEKIVALEGAEDCVVTSSGMAAEMCAVLAVCKAGDEIVSMLDVYGGTLALFEKVFAKFGVKTRFVPYREIDRIGRYFNRRTRMLFLETPTNPTLRCVDIARLSAIAKSRGVISVVDNTFATPILQ